MSTSPAISNMSAVALAVLNGSHLNFMVCFN